ncbi:MAG: hypothetical protein MI746_18470 [Pseudomonadales bacterium]|nr:hypothetical protein [Pseudomonadales bacterium]
MNISRLIFMAYFAAWLLVMVQNVAFLSFETLVEVFGNALIVSLFVGLGLNVNAFLIRNSENTFISLQDRFDYIQQHIGNVFAFFAIPFCVSSASSIVVAGQRSTIVQALFGTSSYSLILLLGFLFFIAAPAAMVYYFHGWKRTELTDS